MTLQQITRKVQQGRLRLLLKNWSLVSQDKEKLQKKTRRLSPEEELKPSLLKKLSSWIEQIAILERKELDIINEISFVEKTHGLMRQEKKLRHAEPKPKEFLPEPEEKNNFWFWMIMLTLFFSDKKKIKVPQNG